MRILKCAILAIIDVWVDLTLLSLLAAVTYAAWMVLR